MTKRTSIAVERAIVQAVVDGIRAETTTYSELARAHGVSVTTVMAVAKRYGVYVRPPSQFKRGELTAETLRNILHYNPGTGVFTWTRDRRNAKAGETAGSVDRDGYIRISIYNRG